MSLAAYVVSTYTLYPLNEFSTVDPTSEELASSSAQRITRRNLVFSIDPNTKGLDTLNKDGSAVLEARAKDDTVIPRDTRTARVITKSTSGLPFDVAEPTPLHCVELGGSYKVREIRLVFR